jgi:hypothetical protein
MTERLFSSNIMSCNIISSLSSRPRMHVDRKRRDVCIYTKEHLEEVNLNFFDRLLAALQEGTLKIRGKQKTSKVDETPATVAMKVLENGEFRKLVGVASLMQPFVRWSVKLELLPRDAEETECCIVRGLCPTWFVPMRGKSTPVIWGSVRRTTRALSDKMRSTAEKCRELGEPIEEDFSTGVSDGAPECAKFMWEQAAEDGCEKSGPLHPICGLHGSNNSAKTPLDLTPGFLRNQTKYAKSLQLSGNSQLLRNGMDEIIDEELVLSERPPTVEEKWMNTDKLNQCFGRKHTLSEQDAADRTAIEYCFPFGLEEGDGTIPHWCGGKCGPNGLVSCKAVCKRVGIPAVARRKARCYNKGKWGKQEIPLKDLLKGMMIHNLGPRAYLRKVAKLGVKKTKGKGQAKQGTASTGIQRKLLEAVRKQSERKTGPDSLSFDEEQVLSWGEALARDINDAGTWLSSGKAYEQAASMLASTGPIHRCAYRQMERGGAPWEARERVREIETGARTFQLVEEAMGVEVIVLLEFGCVLGNSDWHPDAIALRAAFEPTLEATSTCFRQLSSAACSFSMRYLRPRQQSPFNMFLCWHPEPEIAKKAKTEIWSDLQCQQHVFAEDYIRRHKGPEGLELPVRGLDSQMEDVENLHGWGRRRAVEQGTDPLTERMSANYLVFQTGWNITRTLSEPEEGAAKRPKPVEEEEEGTLLPHPVTAPLQPEGQNGIGPWRTWIFLRAVGPFRGSKTFFQNYREIVEQNGPEMKVLLETAAAIDDCGGLANYKKLLAIGKPAGQKRAAASPDIDESSSMEKRIKAARLTVQARVRERRLEEFRDLATLRKLAQSRSRDVLLLLLLIIPIPHSHSSTLTRRSLNKQLQLVSLLKVNYTSTHVDFEKPHVWILLSRITTLGKASS